MAFRHDGVRQSRLELSIGTLRRTVSGNVLQIIFQVEKSVFGLQYFEVLYLAEIGLFHPGREGKPQFNSGRQVISASGIVNPRRP